MKNFLSNMFSAIINGQKARNAYILCYNTRQCIAFLNILWDEGFILGFKVFEKNSNIIKIFLHYKKSKPVIKVLKLITKPGHRIYYTINHLWKIKSTSDFVLISTNRGVLTLEKCKKLKQGGEPFIVLK